jgi:nucleoside-diphosphate-sugar epimerase
MRVFLAGATGVIGRRMLPLLVAACHDVTGTTRFIEKAETLRAAGVTPVVVNVYDLAALTTAVAEARPDVVVHQLTDLPFGTPPDKMLEGRARNARIRIEGTRNLVAATIRAGTRRLVAESIAWLYSPGREPYGEDDPLDVEGKSYDRLSVDAVVTLERLVTTTAGLDGIVLRYGRLYGPGIGVDTPPCLPSVHVDAAANAAVLALDRGTCGVYNVADGGGPISIVKARREFGWDPGFRLR